MAKIMGAMCTKRGPCLETAMTIPYDLLEGGMTFVDSFPLDKARNEAVEKFLDSDSTHLLWIDDDVLIRRKLYHQISDQGKVVKTAEFDFEELFEIDAPLAAPVCWMSPRGIPVPAVFNAVDEVNEKGEPISIRSWPRGKIVQMRNDMIMRDEKPVVYGVDAVGGGCYLTRRDVFEKTRDVDGDWFKMTWYDKKARRRYGEDMYFFENCDLEGLKFGIHLGLEVGHMKPADVMYLGHILYGEMQPKL